MSIMLMTPHPSPPADFALLLISVHSSANLTSHNEPVQKLNFQWCLPDSSSAPPAAFATSSDGPPSSPPPSTPPQRAHPERLFGSLFKLDPETDHFPPLPLLPLVPAPTPHLHCCSSICLVSGLPSLHPSGLFPKPPPVCSLEISVRVSYFSAPSRPVTPHCRVGASHPLISLSATAGL